jgi:hypothetical protein
VQLELHGQLHVLDDRGSERQRVVRRELDLPHHLHRVLLGELHERDLRSQVRRRRGRQVDPERRQLPVGRRRPKTDRLESADVPAVGRGA